jgi:uncharacterized protein DUF6491
MFPRPAAWWRPVFRLGGTVLLTTVLQPGFAAPRPAPVVTRAPAVEAGSVRFTRSYGWLPVDARRLVLWAGIEEPYLVDLAPGCSDLPQARVSGISTHNRRLSPRIDSLIIEGAACPVERIQPAPGGTLRSLGLRREDARPVPILPNPVPNPLPTPPPRKTP